MAVLGFKVCALSTTPPASAVSSVKEPQKMHTSGMQKWILSLTVAHAYANMHTQPSPHQ